MQKLPIVVTTVLLFLSLACKKSAPLPPDTSHVPDIYEQMEALQVKAKTVTVDIDKGGSFYGSSCRFVFSPHSLMTLTGDSVSGEVQVTVKEWLTKSDMMYSYLLPAGDSMSLLSAGEVLVSAQQNNKKLIMRPGATFQVNIPRFGSTETGFQVFLIPQQKDYVDDRRIWEMAARKSYSYITYSGDTISLFSDSIGFCNADKFLDNPQYQNFKLNITGVGTIDPYSIHAYTVYDNYMGIWLMNGIDSNIVTETHVPNIPVHFVVTAVKDNVLYGGILGATPTSGSVYTVNLTKTDPAAFKALIDQL
jgi:hypothetical protein